MLIGPIAMTPDLRDADRAGVPVTRSRLGDVARARRRETGQAIVVMVVAILLALAMVATIVDGGNVLAQQRVAQNGADATAEAGAVMLAERLAGRRHAVGRLGRQHRRPPRADRGGQQHHGRGRVLHGHLRHPAAARRHGRDQRSTAPRTCRWRCRSGNGTHALPGGTATAPDCPNRARRPVAGVLVIGRKDVGDVRRRRDRHPDASGDTRATAVAGYLQGYCDATEGDYCALLPIAMPGQPIACDGSNKPVDTGDRLEVQHRLQDPAVPSAPGNVGWLDWDPPAGGAGEVVCSILHRRQPGDRPAVVAVRRRDRQPERRRRRRATCTSRMRSGPTKARSCWCPSSTSPATRHTAPTPTAASRPIVTAAELRLPGRRPWRQRHEQWYRMPSFAFLELCGPAVAGCGGLHGAYIRGNNSRECDTGSGATSCLVGKFMNIMATAPSARASGPARATRRSGSS